MPDKAKKRDKKSDSYKPKTPLKEKVTEVLELPKEIVLDVPKLTMIGIRDLVIENYKGIIEYQNTRIRLNTGAGIIMITGIGMVIKAITSENVVVEGEISSLEFLK